MSAVDAARAAGAAGAAQAEDGEVEPVVHAALDQLKAKLRRQRANLWVCVTQTYGSVAWRHSPKVDDRANEVPGSPIAGAVVFTVVEAGVGDDKNWLKCDVPGHGTKYLPIAQNGETRFAERDLNEDDQDGRHLLHFAVQRDLRQQENADEVVRLVIAEPSMTKEKDKYGKLTLHYAAANQAPLEVVSALLQAFPDAAKEKDKDEKLPLHYAASFAELAEKGERVRLVVKVGSAPVGSVGKIINTWSDGDYKIKFDHDGSESGYTKGTTFELEGG
eukprot:g803.t1